MVLNITPDHLDRHGNFRELRSRQDQNYGAAGGRDFLVLNAEDKPTQMVAAKTQAQIYWFSPRRPIKQGAFVHGESIFFLAKEGGKGRTGDAGGGDYAEGRAQC